MNAILIMIQNYLCLLKNGHILIRLLNTFTRKVAQYFARSFDELKNLKV